MKEIGFIDIQDATPQAFLDRLHQAAAGETPDALAATYIFRSTAKKCAYVRTVPGLPAGVPGEVSEFALGIPVSWLDFRMLTLPFSDRRKMKEVIPFELDNLLLDGSRGVIFDVAAVKSGNDTSDALVCYIRRDLLKSLLDALSSRGIDPKIVTSIELHDALSRGAGDIAAQLLNPATADREERTARAQEELRSPAINLRTGEFAYTRDTRKVEKMAKVAASLLIAIALVVHAHLAVKTVFAKKEAQSVKSHLRQTYTALFPGDRKVTDELYQLKSHLKALQEKADSVLGGDPLQVLLLISQKKQEGVQLNEITISKESVTVKGETAAVKNLDAFKTALSETISSVSVSDAKPLPDGKTLFTLTGKGVY